MKIEVKVDVGETVSVPALECKARIRSIHITERGPAYEIMYFHEGNRKECYIYADEFELTRKAE